jgi:hypothetical protein
MSPPSLAREKLSLKLRIEDAASALFGALKAGAAYRKTIVNTSISAESDRLVADTRGSRDLCSRGWRACVAAFAGARSAAALS